MADKVHIELLLGGVDGWNNWRMEHPEVKPDLREARLVNANLERALLDGVDLSGADLSKAQLSHASLHGANLESATLILADLLGAVLNQANLSGASFFGAFLFGTRLKSANLTGANLLGASLMGADLTSADLTSAHLMGANFHEANLTGAKLIQADMTAVSLVGTRIQDAELDSCWVQGVSCWNLDGTPKRQNRLLITPRNEIPVWVGDLEVAQFLSLVLFGKRENRLFRDRACSRLALVAGRFRGNRQPVADAIQQALDSVGLTAVFVEVEKPMARELPPSLSSLFRVAKVVLVDTSRLPQSGRLFDAATELTPGRPVISLTDEREPRTGESLPNRPEVQAPIRFESPEKLGETLRNRLLALAGEE